MTSWRKDTPITITRDILLQAAQLSCPDGGPPPWWVPQLGCVTGLRGVGCGGEGEGGCHASCPRLLPATALASAPVPSRLRLSSLPSLLCPVFWAVYHHVINCPKLSGLKQYLLVHGLAIGSGFGRDKSLWGPRNHLESPGITRVALAGQVDPPSRTQTEGAGGSELAGRSQLKALPPPAGSSSGSSQPGAGLQSGVQAGAWRGDTSALSWRSELRTTGQHRAGLRTDITGRSCVAISE